MTAFPKDDLIEAHVAIAKRAAQLYLTAASDAAQADAPRFAANAGILSAYNGEPLDETLEEAITELADLPDDVIFLGLSGIAVLLNEHANMTRSHPDTTSAANWRYDLHDIACEITLSLDELSMSQGGLARDRLRAALLRLARVFPSLWS